MEKFRERFIYFILDKPEGVSHFPELRFYAVNFGVHNHKIAGVCIRTFDETD